MYRGFNSTWEERLRDLIERSKIQRVFEYCQGKRHYPMKDHMEWGNTGFLSLNEAWMITDWQVDIEREIHRTSNISRSDALYQTRRFEYPWAFMRLPQRRGCRILDAGGGNATFQYLLSLLHREVVNVDLNEAFLNEVKQIKAKTGLFNNLNILNGNLTKMFIEDNYFDACVCISALEHGSPEDVMKGIKELRRVTRGPVVVTVDVSLDGSTDAECIDRDILSDIVRRLGIDWHRKPVDVIEMTTIRNNDFNIAGIYLHGEELR